jgi:hypothetical protein
MKTGSSLKRAQEPPIYTANLSLIGLLNQGSYMGWSCKQAWGNQDARTAFRLENLIRLGGQKAEEDILTSETNCR